MGRKRKDPREVVDSVLYVPRTGSPWRDPPDEFGPWQSVYHHSDKWAGDGTRRRRGAGGFLAKSGGHAPMISGGAAGKYSKSRRSVDRILRGAVAITGPIAADSLFVFLTGDLAPKADAG